ncbi:AAA family ATPase [Terrihalobacillus insolitus]|uniref:AAA family ATPase n=1 Tax=Terrihalobacillus insolitus TaxID=2950438 RepID=UPI0023403648|nr:AAA family ATPase [Terrihalobacillus insolitus]MDC3413539.1 AAA family ATPase [Terrihalobacillus insolitus]
MKLIHANIYGFGKWEDFQIDFSSSSLTVISGENETGKSTIRQFILFMLFGMPPKKREFFRPKKGGTIGGRLTVWTPDKGEWTIERVHDRRNGEAIINFPDGSSQGEGFLKGQLKGMTTSTYQSIFSYSSLDLRSLYMAKEEDIGNVLLAVGLTGSDKVRAIEKKLDTEASSYFKPQGKNPVINKQLKQLQELDSKFKTIQEEEETYLDRKEKEETLTMEIRDIQQSIQEIKKKRVAVDKHIQALPLLHHSNLVQNKLKQYHNDLMHFPTNGIERYHKWKQQLIPLQSEYNVLQDNAATYKKRMETLRSLLMDEETVKRVNDCLKGKEGYEQARQSFASLKKEIQEIELEIQYDLDQMQIGLSIDDLPHLSLPFDLEDKWHQLKTQMDEITAEKNLVDQEYNALVDEKQQQLKDKEQLEKQMVDVAMYQQAKEKLVTDEQRNANQAVLQFQKFQKTHWSEMENKRKQQSKFLFGTFFVLTIVSVVSAVMWNQPAFYIGASIFAIIGGISTYFFKRSIQTIGAIFHDFSNNPLQQQQHLDSQELERTKDIVATFERQQERVEKLQDRINQLSIAMSKLEERRAFYIQKETKLTNRIQQQIQVLPFLDKINVHAWPKVFHYVRNCMQKNKTILQKKEKQMELKQHIGAFEQSLARLLQDLGKTYKFPEESIQQIEQMEASHRNNQSLFEQNERLYQECTQNMRKLIQRMKPYTDEIGVLLIAAGVKTEEAYLKMGKEQDERKQLQNKKEELFNQLHAILSEQELSILLSDEKQEKTETELQMEIEAYDNEIADHETDLDRKRQQLAEYKSVLKRMENENYSTIRHHFHQEKEKLNNQVKKWAVIQAAKELLHETKVAFQNKHVPMVFERTSHYFSVLTSEAYKEVYPPSKDEPIIVESKSGLRFTVDELSQGTADQLYVSLRIGFSEAMSQTHSLPFLIDDAFVHFDDKRGERMFYLLKEMSKRQQVIYFTCSQHEVLSQERGKVHLLR